MIFVTSQNIDKLYFILKNFLPQVRIKDRYLSNHHRLARSSFKALYYTKKEKFSATFNGWSGYGMKVELTSNQLKVGTWQSNGWITRKIVGKSWLSWQPRASLMATGMTSGGDDLGSCSLEGGRPNGGVSVWMEARLLIRAVAEEEEKKEKEWRKMRERERAEREREPVLANER